MVHCPTLPSAVLGAAIVKTSRSSLKITINKDVGSLVDNSNSTNLIKQTSDCALVRVQVQLLALV